MSDTSYSINLSNHIFQMKQAIKMLLPGLTQSMYSDKLVKYDCVVMKLMYNNPYFLISWFFFSPDYNSLPKFLNRLLGVEVDLQNELFGYFSDTLAEIISRVKKEGLWDMGILGKLSKEDVNHPR